MTNVLREILSEFGTNDATPASSMEYKNSTKGCPGYKSGTATEEHMAKRHLFAQLGTPPGMNPDICLNSAQSSSVPSATIFDEKPEHVIMVVLKSKGSTNKEIAGHTGYTETHVRTVLLQPWAKRRMNLLVGDVHSLVNNFLKNEIIPTLEVVVSLRDDIHQPGSVRLAASVELANRYLGKPVQTIMQGTVKEPVDDQALDAELAAVEARLSEVYMRQPVRTTTATVTETHVTTKTVTVQEQE